MSFCPMCGCRDFNNRCSRCKRSREPQMPEKSTVGSFYDPRRRGTVVFLYGTRIFLRDSLMRMSKDRELVAV